MTKTLGGRLAKIAALLISVLLVLTAAFAFVGCETKRPEISIKLSFNGQTYEMEYKLYRNMYPQTVAHYLELIDMGYFNGTVIHDYQSDRMVGGGYEYKGEDFSRNDLQADNYAAVLKDYDAATKDENGNVTLENISVWADKNKEIAYNTLYGEGTQQMKVVNNGLDNNVFGALGTYYYTPLQDNGADKVWIQKNEGGEMIERSYCYNSATSMFYLYTGSSGSNPEFCIFGLLKDSDDQETFQSLLDAIEEYTLETLNGGDEEGTEEFTTEVPMVIEDEYWGESSYENVTFNVPKAQIVIESIKVLKY